VATQFKKRVSQRTQMGKASEGGKCLIGVKGLVLIGPESACPVGEQCDPTNLDQTFPTPILGSCFTALQFLMTYTGGPCGPGSGEADLTVYYDDGSTYTNSYYTSSSSTVDVLADIDKSKKISRIKIEPNYVDISDISCPGTPSPLDVTIAAHCNPEGEDLSVPITEDGAPTGFDTSHTFAGLVGSHAFTVPSYDANGHPFLQWSTGETGTTVVVSVTGTYTAYYYLPPVGRGQLGFNVCKPYYYNGWYYVFYFLRIYPYTTYYEVCYAKSQDLITWDKYDLWTLSTWLGFGQFDDSLIFGCMAVDDKVFIVDLNATTFESRTGTIQADGTISFNDPVTLYDNGYNYGAVSGVRIAKIGGNRKLFVIYLRSTLGIADPIYISDDDGATWTMEGEGAQSVLIYFGRENFRMIPFNDGNKFIQLVAPRQNWPIEEGLNHLIYGEYRDPQASNEPVELGSYRYGEFNNGDIPHGIMPWFVSSVDSGAEGCKLGDWIHVAYVGLDGTVQHKRANVASPDTWEDLGLVGSLTGENLCASPVADATNSAVYIFYSDLHNIYYKRWTEAGGLESQVTFYTVANPTVWNILKNLTVYPDAISGRIIVAWMQLYGVLAQDWNVYCSVLGGGTVLPHRFGQTLIGDHEGTEFGFAEACKHVSSRTGTVESVSLYIQSGAASGRYARVAIYAVDGNGDPGALIQESASEEITANGWHTFSGFNCSVVDGTFYYLAFQVSDVNLTIAAFYTGGTWRYRAYNYDAFPDPFAYTGQGASDVSIYCTVA